jgi:hypothetical protein
MEAGNVYNAAGGSIQALGSNGSGVSFDLNQFVDGGTGYASNSAATTTIIRFNKARFMEASSKTVSNRVNRAIHDCNARHLRHCTKASLVLNGQKTQPVLKKQASPLVRRSLFLNHRSNPDHQAQQSRLAGADHKFLHHDEGRDQHRHHRQPT